MKLLEFFRTIRENVSNGTGTFVGARLTRESERDITRWMRDNGLRKKEPRARMHITVVGDKEHDFDWNPATFKPPLEIDPASYKIEKFDHGSIVLSFSVPELEKRHEQAVEDYAIQWDFPTYQPHITLSYDPTDLNDVERLLTPTFPMYVSHEYEQPWSFTESDTASERRRSARLDEAFLAERNLMNAPLAKKWAGHAAETLFGSEVGAALLPMGLADPALKWAHRALARYFVNDMPASRLLSFTSGDDNGTWRPPATDFNQQGIEGHGEIITPQDAAYGITSGHQGLRSITVPPWVPATLERGDELYFLDQRGVNHLVNSSMFGAVKDWFRYLANNHPEKLKTGALNRLSWEEAVESAVEWHQAMRAAETSDDEENENHRVMYIDYGNGIAWWKLIGETCLTREGKLMGHCVADYVHDIINQVKGKENKPPVEKYWKYVDALIKKLDADGLELSASGEGPYDLSECEIEIIGPLLVRISPPLHNITSQFHLIQQHADGSQKDVMEGSKGTDLFVVFHTLRTTYNIFPTGEAEQYLKWLLLRDGEWEIDTETIPDVRGEYDFVPTHINIKVPKIEYEVLAGNPKDFKYDLKHEIAVHLNEE